MARLLMEVSFRKPFRHVERRVISEVFPDGLSIGTEVVQDIRLPIRMRVLGIPIRATVDLEVSVRVYSES